MQIKDILKVVIEPETTATRKTGLLYKGNNTWVRGDIWLLHVPLVQPERLFFKWQKKEEEDDEKY